jgi:hypothetical protein
MGPTRDSVVIARIWRGFMLVSCPFKLLIPILLTRHNFINDMPVRTKGRSRFLGVDDPPGIFIYTPKASVNDFTHINEGRAFLEGTT